MSSGLPRRVHKKVVFRLVLWYSSVLFLSAVFLLALAFFLLQSYLAGQDRATVLLKLMELRGSYQVGGMASLDKEIDIERSFGKRNPFLIRVLRENTETLFLVLPSSLRAVDLPSPAEMAGNEERISSLPLRDGKGALEWVSASLGQGYVLQVGKATTERDRLLARFREILAAVMIPTAICGLLGGWLLAYRSLLPLRHLAETVKAVYSGRMGRRAPISKTGEPLDELVVLFNAMLERIETLIRGLRDSLDNVAHDLRTPMTRLRGVAELALQSGQDLEAIREALAECVEESERILTMLNSLLDITEAETGTIRLDLRNVSLTHLVDEVVELYRYITEEKDVRISASGPEDLFLVADPNRIRQVLGNLLDNAVKYTGPGGDVEVQTRREEDEIVISVRDTGVGISAEELPRIWERLYRGDHSRSQKGLGLGLSLVKAIVHAHRGRVDVVSATGTGSTFTVYLPTSA